MAVAEACIDTHQHAGPGLCRVRVWLLPADSPHHAEQRARTIIRDVLGCVGTADDDVDDAEHIVAELAVNAVQHATPPYELRIVYTGEAWPVWCEVADSSLPVDTVRRRLHGTVPADDAAILELSESGRGLHTSGPKCTERWFRSLYGFE